MYYFLPRYICALLAIRHTFKGCLVFYGYVCLVIPIKENVFLSSGDV